MGETNLYYYNLNQYVEVKEPLPYREEREAVDEILSYVDALCYAIFAIRDLWEERLDMRGIVITPKECLEAISPHNPPNVPLHNWPETRNYDSAVSPSVEEFSHFRADRRQMGRQLNTMLGYLTERGKKSLEAGRPVRIWKLCADFSLSPRELLYLFLALALECDRKYERIYGYIQDNVADKQPTLGLGLSLVELVFQEAAAEQGLDDPPLSGLLKAMEGAGKESRLSTPLILGDMAWNYIRAGSWICDTWKSVLSGRREDGELRLIVSMTNLLQYRKEENRSARSAAGEIMAAARGMGVKTLIFEYGRRDHDPEEFSREKAYLNSLVAGGGLLSEWRAAEGEMDAFCTPIQANYTWEDLILEEESKKLLRQMINQVEYRDVVREQWGFGKKDPYGNGISALFFGPPGTGKTMAAQVIAGELEKKLFKVDVSRLVSKYIGETEKHVSELFAAGNRSGAVLFFDEADGLFAKRSEVSSSNDRYANTETGFLLQKLEEYDGISILATNFANNIDDAFKRRIRFLVRFPFPSPEMRYHLWQRMFPEQALIEEDLRLEIPARRFELTGSGIREAAIQAAYLAAAAGRGIRRRDIGDALKLHYTKYGKNLAGEELEW